MPSITEQLAALSVTDSLKHAAMPETFSKLPWATLGAGTWSEAAGWAPEGYLATGEPGSRSGTYYNAAAFKGGNAAVGIKKTSGSLLNNDRRLGLWLFTAAGAKASGYQLQWVTITKTDVAKFVLSKWVEGVRSVLAEAPEVAIAGNDSFYLVAFDGKVSLWRRTGEGTPELVGAEVEDATFTEGRVAIDGNGSNPKMVDLVSGTLEAPPDLDAPSTRVSIREFPRLDLHYEAKTPNGRFYRWGKDEPRPENVPSGGAFSSTMPGGHEGMNINLPRKPGIDYSDLERLTTIRAIGAGGEVASEVRLERTPRVSGDQFSIGPEAKGWSAHLQDDTSAAEIYVDRSLSWQEPSAKRRSDLQATAQLGSLSTVSDATTGAPGLTAQVGQVPFTLPLIEAWFDAGNGLTIASVDIKPTLLTFGLPDASLSHLIGSSDDDVATSFSGNDLKASNGVHTTITFGTARRWVLLQLYWTSSAGGSAGKIYGVTWQELAAWGSHGLTKQGTSPLQGLLASDIIANAISRWAPLLRFSTGPTGTIRPSGYAIPHASFKDKTTVQTMVDVVNAYELRPYAVWDGPDPRRIEPTFYYHDWGQRGKTWRLRIAPTQLTETGPTVDRLRNGVVVQWQDVDGSTRTAGPIGSGCDAEDASLEDRDPENPANKLGIPMYGDPIPLGISVESEAIRVGALNLARFKETDTSGEAQIVGVAEDDKGVTWPYWKPKAGDMAEFIDASDKRARRIIRVAPNEDTFTNTITLDAPPEGTTDLIAQMAGSISDLAL